MKNNSYYSTYTKEEIDSITSPPKESLVIQERNADMDSTIWDGISGTWLSVIGFLVLMILINILSHGVIIIHF